MGQMSLSQKSFVLIDICTIIVTVTVTATAVTTTAAIAVVAVAGILVVFASALVDLPVYPTLIPL